MELKCAVQEYAWGKKGESSAVALLAQNAAQNFSINPDVPYAELWMGTHPSGPSLIAETEEPLSSILEASPDVLGEKVREKFGNKLPFLFKVLSVGKALSIQAHPNKTLAEQLHKERPHIYKDPNHKPEIALALTEFQGLCGFRPLKEIQNNLNEIPELVVAVTAEKAEALKKANDDNYAEPLKDCFTQLMNCSKEVLATQLDKLSKRLTDCSASQGCLLTRLYGHIQEMLVVLSSTSLTILSYSQERPCFWDPMFHMLTWQGTV